MGLSRILEIRKCAWCGSDIEIRHKNRVGKESTCCCIQCSMDYRKSKLPLNATCSYCVKMFHLKESKLNKYTKHYCSMDCNKKDKSNYMSGEGNHQYGLKGNLNDSWKSDSKITNYGYKKVRCLEHPFKDCDGFVFEHRLIAEKYLLNESNSICIDGKFYLSNKYEVHHIDKNRLNNLVNNLMILTKSDHMRLHAKERWGSTNKEG